MRRSLLLGCLLVLLVPLIQMIGLRAALAVPICPTSPHPDYAYGEWNTSTAKGVQAPIQLRKTGTVCNQTNINEDGADSAWIGLQATDNSALVQAGFVHFYNELLDAVQYCRVWAKGTGKAHPYKCGDDTGSTYVYFQIIEFLTPPPDSTYYYDILDCGTDGYATCTSKDASQVAFSSGAFGAVVAESDYGTGCFDQIMGSSGSPVNAGTDVNPIKWQGSVGGSWATKTLGQNNAVCSDYKIVVSNTIVTTWDDRN